MENILKDIEALGLKWDKLTYTSDYFDQMLELAPKLIGAGKIYADDTPLLQMRAVSHAPLHHNATFLSLSSYIQCLCPQSSCKQSVSSSRPAQPRQLS